MKHRMKGFTLLELALVLLALGLILPGATMLWQYSERHRVAAVQMDLQQQTRDALTGFLHASYRLPCPAADIHGVESCTAGAAPRQVGYVPWRTLGLPRPQAGGMRYGVYREPSAAALASAPQDRDLAVLRDRMNPLRVRTPLAETKNHDTAPNPNAPPIPQVRASLGSVLGVTQSGQRTAPLNAACNAKNQPPCPLGSQGAVNLIDVCLALNTASGLAQAPGGGLATIAEVRRPAAFVLVAAGMLDADGNGQAFEGRNASASDADPTFEAPDKAVTHLYDDTVMAVSHAELFTQLQCAGALSAISHAHFNVATGAFVMERAMYDYRDQLYISKLLAQSSVEGAAAGMAAAVAGTLDAAKEMVSALGDTLATAGARSFQIVMAGVGIGLAIAADAAAIAAQVDAALSYVEAKQVFDDFKDRTQAMTELSHSINVNALTADAIGH